MEEKKMKQKMHVVSGVLKGMMILFAVAAVLDLTGVVLCTAIPQKMEQVLLAGSFWIEGGTIGEAKMMLLFEIFHLLLLEWTLYDVYQIFQENKDESSPFQIRNIKRIKRIALLAVLNLTAINFFVGLGTGAAIYGIAVIFEYGCKLQKLEDETL